MINISFGQLLILIILGLLFFSDLSLLRDKINKIIKNLQKEKKENG